MARASIPTIVSTISFPEFSWARLRSESLILRLELARSVTPSIKLAIPTPEPPPDTCTLTSGWTLLYSSAQACARLTIVSDPSTRIVLDDVPPLSVAELQPTAATMNAKTTPNSFFKSTLVFLFVGVIESLYALSVYREPRAMGEPVMSLRNAENRGVS